MDAAKVSSHVSGPSKIALHFYPDGSVGETNWMDAQGVSYYHIPDELIDEMRAITNFSDIKKQDAHGALKRILDIIEGKAC